MTDKYEVLRKYFGYSSFRNGQEELIDALLDRRDVLGIMPTGAGKSLCYQIPAMLFDGLTVVISPLISLMKDQVSALVQQGIKAAFINSSLNSAQYCKVLQNLRLGVYKIVYVAPERLLSESFLQLCSQIKIDLIAIDEAHCVSQWGQDFRPSYLDINKFIDLLPYRPVIGAFTATATSVVRDDIVKILRLQNPVTLTTGFDRPNLFFSVMKPDDKKKTLLALLNERRDKSGIIYCSTRKKVEEVCYFLNGRNIKATRYHAGLTSEERQHKQEDFVHDRIPVIVATNAFGMGIDKSNVSFVIHFNMPKDLESYYQEAGRAGRDGAQADCILLYGKGDVRTAQFFIDSTEPNPNLSDEENKLFIEREEERLKHMVFYSTTTDCLRKYMLRYFGDNYKTRCENCSNCLTDFETVDITIEAQKILSCIIRMQQRFGKTMVANVLKGKMIKDSYNSWLSDLSTFGIMKEKSLKEIIFCIDKLIELGYIRQDGEYSTLKTTQKARAVLHGEEQISVKKAKTIKVRKDNIAFAINHDLLAELKKLRLKLAKTRHVPAYVIFTDKTLINMSYAMPTTESEFLNISGVSERKLKSYGKEFMGVIEKYKEPEKMQKQGYHSAYKEWTESEIYNLKSRYLIGLSITQLAELHGRTKDEIRSRLKKEGLIK